MLKHSFFVMYSVILALRKGVKANCQIWMLIRGRWAATRLFWLQPDTTTRSVFGRPTVASAPGQSSTRIPYPYSKLQTITTITQYNNCKMLWILWIDNATSAVNTFCLEFLTPFLKWLCILRIYSIWCFACILSIWHSLFSRLITHHYITSFLIKI